MPALRTNIGHRPRLVVLGLTGGIASGKTTVAGMFAELGAVVLNADEEGRAIVVPGEPALAEIAAAFGPRFLQPDGTLDRAALAERIFASRGDREVLNRITHGRIAARLAARLDALARRPPPSGVVVIEAALLIEAGWASLVDRIVVIATEPDTSIDRLRVRSGLSASQAEARLRAQLPLEQRLRHAQFCVRGDTALSETREQVHAVWKQVTRAVPGTSPKR